MSTLPNKSPFNEDFIKLHVQFIKKEGSCYWPNCRFESLPVSSLPVAILFTNVCSSFVALKIKPTTYLIQHHNFNVFKHCNALEIHILITGNTDDRCLSCWTLPVTVIYESLYSSCLAKIVWQTSTQIKCIFLKASNTVLFPMQIWKAFLPNLKVLVPINFEGKKINNLAPLL